MPVSKAKVADPPASGDDLKTIPVAEVEKRLGSFAHGLTQVEAAKRLIQYGPNEIVEKHVNALRKLLGYFRGPIPWMIEVAVVLSAVLGHWPDFFIILVLLLANSGIGFWEERQAGQAIAALKAELAVKARVKRDGEWVTPPARELVPGDVIRLRLGDAVYSASIIRRGEIGALVYATGANTYFGKTTQLVQEAPTVSHFQRAVLKIGKFLIILAVALVAVIIVVSVLRGGPTFTTLQFALVLTVAAIPVAMPTVLSVTMAVGAKLLATKKAIVSRLVAIEELAGVDVLCTDKTGTLTQNLLTLGDPFVVADVTADQIILDAALASRADDADQIDLAILGGLNSDQDLEGYQIQSFQPFDAVRKCTEATVTAPGGASFKVTKGAPQVIMALSAFLARTRGPFWSTRPARVLLLVVLGTPALATFIAVYGVFMAPIEGGYAALVWGYALTWFLVTDRIKLLAYQVLDPLLPTAPQPREPAATDNPHGQQITNNDNDKPDTDDRRRCDWCTNAGTPTP